MSALKLIYHFFSHSAAFGFWSSSLPDNVTLTPANRKADQRLSEFQAGIGAAAHASLNMEQLISCPKVALVDTASYLLDSEGGVTPVSKVQELLTKVHDILDNTASKWLVTQLLFWHVFNSASRQNCEVLESQYPFLYSLKNMVPQSEACQYGGINWSVAQAQQQSSIGLS